MFHLDSTTDDT